MKDCEYLGYFYACDDEISSSLEESAG